MSNNRFCAMLDMSRNGVMLPEKVKEYIDILAKMGYNALMLYTEDTYEVAGEPLFGYLRGAYTAAEIKDIDRYAQEKGIELIPCIQTLAHLNCIFRWKEYRQINDLDDILLIGAERTYQLIENMFLTLQKNFTSRTVLIGMDEAHLVGRGKFADANGFLNRFEIMCEHLKKVSAIAERYGFETLMWSDMLLRLVNGGAYYGEHPVPAEVAKNIPRNVSPVYWDYYHVKECEYDKYFDLHQNLSNVWFAGGTGSWYGFVPNLQLSLAATEASMRVCKKRRVNNVIMTVWGDNGRECSCFTALPILYYAIEIYHGHEDMNEIKKGFYEITGENFDDFLLLEYPNFCSRQNTIRDNPSKYMFYNDPFFGLFDANVKGNEKEFYEKGTRLLGKAGKRSRSFRYIYDYEKSLCSALALKAALGAKTREYYLQNDLQKLSELIGEYETAVRRIKVFMKSLEKLWETENKANGLEVQHIRIGGLIERLIYCKNRIGRYINGEIDKIPELETERIDAYGLKDKTASGFAYFNSWKSNASVNNL